VASIDDLLERMRNQPAAVRFRIDRLEEQ